ncbi:type IV pilus modification PilV family protein [Ectopseudomonas oleovorans]|uniref:type IV pilus modification PilV family protein n=1 Tax=Ectopseudomonas oleovorans TaxID=301 RepID=UPI0019CFFF67|nr:type II secretion system protein [Pseudomonas oleovorans]
MSLLSDVPYKQRGDILLESLISMVLMSIVGLGLVYAASRVAATQGEMNEQNIAVSEMREMLQNSTRRDNCSSSSTLQINCSYADINITIGDSSQSIRVMTLSDTASGVCVREVGGPECSN